VEEFGFFVLLIKIKNRRETMITKNNYLRFCPTTTKLLLGVVAGLLTLICETSFAADIADIKEWNFRKDFLESTSVLTRPVIQDKNGYDTWFLKYSPDSNYPEGAFNSSTFQPMNTFLEEDWFGFGNCINLGLKGWALNSDLPFVALNSIGGDITCYNQFTVPAGAVYMHPVPNAAVVVEWHSPINGLVYIVGTGTDLDGACGNGITWFLGKNSTKLSSGALDNGYGNTVSFSKSVMVKVGDILYMGVGPRDAEHACDTTQLDIVVSRPPDGAPFGPQGHGCGITQ
jgi:hypothetical protein